MDDYLIFWFGDGEGRGGVEGEIRNIISGMKPSELARLLGSSNRQETVRNQAIAAVLSRTEAYPLSAALTGLGVRSDDIGSAIASFRSKLRNDELAAVAWTAATIRAEAVPTGRDPLREEGRELRRPHLARIDTRRKARLNVHRT